VTILDDNEVEVMLETIEDCCEVEDNSVELASKQPLTIKDKRSIGNV
jgi:hypothetical protein